VKIEQKNYEMDWVELTEGSSALLGLGGGPYEALQIFAIFITVYKRKIKVS
jgi:hypothetical protein